MNILRTDCQVYTVRSFEEAEKIIVNNKLHATDFIKKLLINVWVLWANGILSIFCFFLFRKIDYSLNNVGKIIAYTHGIVGDNVVMLPALAAIKKRFPNSKITVIADLGPYPKAPSEIFQGVDFVDDLIVINKQPLMRKGLKLIIDPKLKGVNCDLFVDLSPYGNRGWLKAVLRELLFAWMIHAEYAIGFYVSTKMSQGIFNGVQHYFIKNEPRRPAKILDEIGLKPLDNVDLLPKNNAAKEAVLKKIQNRVKKLESFFIINPGGNIEVKHWSYEKFGKIAQWINDHYRATVIITGTSAEKEIAEKVVEASGGIALSMAGETTIQELIELLRLSTACITNDSGTMHLAAMIGVPTVAIFGTRLSPTWWFPKGENIIALFCLLKCSYCFQDFCDSKECLKRIEVSHVIHAIERMLEESERQ